MCQYYKATIGGLIIKILVFLFYISIRIAIGNELEIKRIIVVVMIHPNIVISVISPPQSAFFIDQRIPPSLSTIILLCITVDVALL